MSLNNNYSVGLDAWQIADESRTGSFELRNRGFPVVLKQVAVVGDWSEIPQLLRIANQIVELLRFPFDKRSNVLVSSLT